MWPSSDIKVDEKTITKEDVEKWLKMANLEKLNVFHDRNKMIIILCKALLNAWENKEKKS
tara:strand:+ start:313 stop:492 length:180 start_codon:yes stop_codon:yes gene_type:complete